MIEARNIHKYYDNLHVLKGVDISIASGEIVSIVGASGAGKTTLLQILGTLDKANEGSLNINNTNISALSRKELAKFRNSTLGFIYKKDTQSRSQPSRIGASGVSRVKGQGTSQA